MEQPLAPAEQYSSTPPLPSHAAGPSSSSTTPIAPYTTISPSPDACLDTVPTSSFPFHDPPVSTVPAPTIPSSVLPMDPALAIAEPTIAPSSYGPPDGSWAPETAPGQTGLVFPQKPKPRPVFKPVAAPPTPTPHPIVIHPLIIDPALLGDTSDTPSTSPIVQKATPTISLALKPTLPLQAPAFSVVPQGRPTTPPPNALVSAADGLRSPLGPRQSNQSMRAPASQTAAHPSALDEQNTLEGPSAGSFRPQTPAAGRSGEVEVPDLKTSVDRKILPAKMKQYYDLFVKDKGSWGDGWARCIESFVRVEAIDGSPVRF